MPIPEFNTKQFTESVREPLGGSGVFESEMSAQTHTLSRGSRSVFGQAVSSTAKKQEKQSLSIPEWQIIEADYPNSEYNTDCRDRESECTDIATTQTVGENGVRKRKKPKRTINGTKKMKKRE